MEASSDRDGVRASGPASELRRLSEFASNVLIALGFVAGGLFSALGGSIVRGPGGQSAIVWLPSGIALAGLVSWGRRAWPGVWVGALAVDGAVLYLGVPSAGLLRVGLLTLIVSAADVAQALAAATLLRRKVDPSLALARPRAVLGVLLVAAGTSIIAAGIGSGALLAAGVRSQKNVPYDFLAWWASETVGTFLVAPVLLAWTAEPAHVWRPRRLQLTVPLVLTLLFSAAAFNSANRLEDARIRAALALGVDHLTAELEHELDSVDEDAQALGELMRLDAVDLDTQEFERLVGHLGRRRVNVYGVAWLPRVTAAERAAHEADVRARDQPDYEIREPGPGGRAVRAGERAEYFPAALVCAPAAASLRGLDLAVVPGRRELIGETRRSGALVMSAPVELYAMSGRTPGTLVYVPVYARGAPAGKSRELVGFVGLAIPTWTLMRELLKQPSAQGLDVRVVDTRAVDGSALLFASGDAPASGDAARYRSTREVKSGGRTWLLTSVPTEEYLRSARTWLAPAISVMGFLFSALLCGFLLVVTGNAANTRRLVAERTRELSSTNEQLREVILVQQRTGQALKEGEARLHFAVEEAGNGLWDLDVSNERMYCSPRLLEVLGRPPEPSNWTLDEWSATIHPEDRAASRLQLDQHLRGETPFYTCEKRMQRKDGSYVWLLAKGKVVERAPDGTALRIIGTQFDISERKLSEWELARIVQARTWELEVSKGLAEAANRTKSAFLANMSHELRTPMHAVLAYARLALDAGLAPRQHGYVLRIVESGERLLVLLNELLDLSKLEAGKVTIERAPHDLAQIVREVALELDPLFADKRLSLEVTRDEQCSDVVAAVDRVRIGHLFRNLLANAVKFSGEGGKVRIRFANAAAPASTSAPPGAAAAGRALAISISDEGIGIPEDELELIFDSFVQSSKTHTAAGGTGLGLAICREIAKLHGGSVRARNNVGAGATFTVTIPVAAKPVEREREVA